MKLGRAIRLVPTQGMSREEWLSVRHRGIGASDAAAAIGPSSYTSPLALWLEKTGRKSAVDLGQSEAVLIGGQDFRIYRVEREDDKIAELVEREQQFWRYVTDDTPPAPRWIRVQWQGLVLAVSHGFGRHPGLHGWLLRAP